MKYSLFWLILLILAIPSPGIQTGDSLTYTLSVSGESSDLDLSLTIYGHRPINHPQEASWALLNVDPGDSVQITVEDADFDYIPPLIRKSHGTSDPVTNFDIPDASKVALIKLENIIDGTNMLAMDGYDASGIYVDIGFLESEIDGNGWEKIATDSLMGYKRSSWLDNYPISNPAELEVTYFIGSGLLNSYFATITINERSVELSFAIKQETVSIKAPIIPFSFTSAIFCLILLPLFGRSWKNHYFEWI